MNNQDWYQTSIKHCPNPQCKGMLLQSDEEDYYKCSNCEKHYEFFGEWKMCE